MFHGAAEDFLSKVSIHVKIAITVCSLKITEDSHLKKSCCYSNLPLYWRMKGLANWVLEIFNHLVISRYFTCCLNDVNLTLMVSVVCQGGFSQMT